VDPDNARRAGIVVSKMTSRFLRVSFPSKMKENNAQPLVTSHRRGRGSGENDGR
jgi:hypothetical protein